MGNISRRKKEMAFHCCVSYTPDYRYVDDY